MHWTVNWVAIYLEARWLQITEPKRGWAWPNTSQQQFSHTCRTRLRYRVQGRENAGYARVCRNDHRYRNSHPECLLWQGSPWEPPRNNSLYSLSSTNVTCIDEYTLLGAFFNGPAVSGLPEQDTIGKNRIILMVRFITPHLTFGISGPMFEEPTEYRF